MAITGFLIMGVSGCGKTSVGQALAARLGWDFFDADDFHPPENVARMAAGIPLTDTDRAPWLAALHERLGSTLEAGRRPVLACSALKERYRRQLLAGNHGIRLVYLKGSFSLIRERLAGRVGHYMNPALLQSQFDDLEEPQEALVVDAALPLDQIVEQVLENSFERTKENPMDIAVIGLGRMGLNIATRLVRSGHRVVAYDLDEAAVRSAGQAGAEQAHSLTEAVERLPPPRSLWVMLPAGEATESTIQALSEFLAGGDTILDGGNSNYKDSQRRAEALSQKGIHFLDVGTSGGIWGLSAGYSLMVGGRAGAVERHRPLFETLAPAADKGWAHVGPSGAGHFVKMIHNGIEYGMMQAFAEGFEILKAKQEFALDLHQVAEVWRHGSVVRSWLLDLVSTALAEDASLTGIQPWVADSGEGRWTVAEAVDLDVPAPVITLALLMRLASRDEESYAARLLAAMRNQFGGHAVKTREE